jgi:hypothetical protein
LSFLRQTDVANKPHSDWHPDHFNSSVRQAVQKPPFALRDWVDFRNPNSGFRSAEMAYSFFETPKRRELIQ